jgi:sec-independent protein translocase protein TatC
MAKKRDPERKMSLGGHLVELRNRLFWSAIFVAAGTVLGWYLFDPVFAMLQQPIAAIAEARDVTASINFGTVVGAFDTRIQVSIFLGILVASPFWLYHFWAFITPGLKSRERKYTFAFLGAAVPLFVAGVWLAWISIPSFVTSLLSFTPAGAANVINANEYMLFIIRVLTVFGLAFVLPVALVVLNFAGVMSAKTILKGWRLAIFLISVIAALATPVSDPMSMFLLMIPLIALYYAAAGIAAIRDKAKSRGRAAAEAKIEAELAGAGSPLIE